MDPQTHRVSQFHSRRAMLGLFTSLGSLGALCSNAVALELDPDMPPEMDPDLTTFLNDPTNGILYFTPAEQHGLTTYGKIPADKLTPAQLSAAGLTPESWKLEITGEFKQMTQRTVKAGNAITFTDLQRMAEQRPIKVLKTMTSIVGDHPLGSGVWGGVALRDLIRLMSPHEEDNILRISVEAFDPADANTIAWCGSLSPARVMEEASGWAPVILALTYNGAPIPARMGGPVRLIVPEHYEHKCTPHVRRISLRNTLASTDTIAAGGLDAESPVKTCAQTIRVPATTTVGKPLIADGIVQVGQAGLSGVEYAIVPAGTTIAADDPYAQKLPWQKAQVLPPPANFRASIPGGDAHLSGLSVDQRAAIAWPIPGFHAHWVAVIHNLKPGKYSMYARAIDRHSEAQPLPRPFPSSGVATIPTQQFVITA